MQGVAFLIRDNMTKRTDADTNCARGDTMNTRRTSDYVSAFERGTKDLATISSGFNAKCPKCLRGYGYRDTEDGNGNVIVSAESKAGEDQESGRLPDEASFSWRACDTCGTTLGGDREYGHALDSRMDIVHLSMCADCVMFIANGDIPDDETEWETPENMPGELT